MRSVTFGSPNADVVRVYPGGRVGGTRLSGSGGAPSLIVLDQKGPSFEGIHGLETFLYSRYYILPRISKPKLDLRNVLLTSV